LSIEPVDGTAKVLIGVKGVRARSLAEASAQARDLVLRLVPATGYRITEPEPVEVQDRELVPA
jgi:hypothetical protein